MARAGSIRKGIVMNVRSSKDWGEIAGLIATGELESYTGLVALATEAEEMIDLARGIAATAGSKLQELAELGYAGRTPSVYAGVAPGVFEAAAYEFLKIVEPETEPEDLVPNSYGAAALYLTGYDEEYRIQSEIVTEFTSGLRQIAADAEYRATAARALPGEISAAAVRAAAAYRALARQALRAADGLTPEN